MTGHIRRLARAEDGATMVEYGLMVAMVGAPLVAVFVTLSGPLRTSFSFVSNTLSGPGSPGDSALSTNSGTDSNSSN